MATILKTTEAPQQFSLDHEGFELHPHRTAVDPGIPRYFIENEHRLHGPTFLAFMREARDWFAARARRKADILRGTAH